MSEARIESTELYEYRLAVRDWLADNVPPKVGMNDDVDAEDPSPNRIATLKGTQMKLYEAGYAGFAIPKEYGGQGLTLDHERVFVEEAVDYDVPTRFFGVSINILGAALAAFGTHQQKQHHLPRILSGQERWLQFLSEPSGGSDLAGLLTSATRDGDNYVVNGQKVWSTAAHLSDYAMCPVRTSWDVPKHKGISVLIIDLRSPGIEIRRIRQIDGGAEFCEEFLTDLEVPVSNLVGTENDGWRVARGILEIEHAWVGRGWARSDSFEGVSNLVALSKRKGRDDDPGIRRQLAGLHVTIEAQRLVSARVSQGIERGKLSPAYGSLLKLGNVRVMQRRAETGLALAGGDGVTWDPRGGAGEWGQAFLFSRGSSIGGGTDEIQRNNVSEKVLGLPREPSSDRDIPFNQIPHN
jgi:alkylation response protein AidB-like acyl-CoA dehydrogenase